MNSPIGEILLFSGMRKGRSMKCCWQPDSGKAPEEKEGAWDYAGRIICWTGRRRRHTMRPGCI